ncbi:MAG: tRNA threonylcarbamoyladenosine biosynthesis protein RimN [Acinetobacter sp.]|jgi:L-threonylcarbamoyladenylate synthase|nr:MAG: tRNA threonylcarbamoyladenosine biosynthesis protein RimN [Acinetobacter sp.]
MNHVSLEQAIECLKQGDVLAYPTEAVWGLGCDPFQQTAFEKILQLKQRPIEKGVILLSESIARVEPLLARLDADIRQRVLASWQYQGQQQRATTWLLPITDEIPTWIYGDHDRVAVRVTQHPLCQQLCRYFDHFIVSTSANPAGLEPARTAEQVVDYFPEIAILAGKLGSSPEPSRILDAVTGLVVRG